MTNSSPVPFPFRSDTQPFLIVAVVDARAQPKPVPQVAHGWLWRGGLHAILEGVKSILGNLPD